MPAENVDENSHKLKKFIVPGVLGSSHFDIQLFITGVKGIKRLRLYALGSFRRLLALVVQLENWYSYLCCHECLHRASRLLRRRQHSSLHTLTVQRNMMSLSYLLGFWNLYAVSTKRHTFNSSRYIQMLSALMCNIICTLRRRRCFGWVLIMPSCYYGWISALDSWASLREARPFCCLKDAYQVGWKTTSF